MKKRKIYDISLTIHPGMVVWPGDVKVKSNISKSTERGDFYNLSQWQMSAHTGTHIDAPLHFIRGAPGIDSIDLEILLGKARLFQLPEVKYIDRNVLERLNLEGVTRLLLGTTNSSLLKQPEFSQDYVYATEDAARYMVEIGIKLVGIDYLSIGDYKDNEQTAHHILLGAGVVIVEGIDLSGIPSNDYELICLPIKLENSDGAPARVLLREL